MSNVVVTLSIGAGFVVSVLRERFVGPADPRLGRHVNHDERSKRYAFRAPDRVTLRTVHHERHVPVFDQGTLGRCVPTSGLGCLATGHLFQAYQSLVSPPYPLSDGGAVSAYRDVTRMDPYDGEWEPNDTGSDGLSMAKLLVSKGAIAGYQHTFSLSDMLAALMKSPLITGTVWRRDMYQPDRNGIVHPTGAVQGGHEYVIDSFDAQTNLVGFTNSWGTSWGWQGRFFMRAEDFGTLLEQNGDVTMFVPVSDPAPIPDVPDDPDRLLVSAVGPWARRSGLCAPGVRRALRTWMSAKGL